MNHFAVFIFLNSISSSIGLYDALYVNHPYYPNYGNYGNYGNYENYVLPNHQVEYVIGEYDSFQSFNRHVPDRETEIAYINQLNIPVGSSYHATYKNGRPHYDYAFHNNAHHNHHDYSRSRPNANRGNYYMP